MIHQYPVDNFDKGNEKTKSLNLMPNYAQPYFKLSIPVNQP